MNRTLTLICLGGLGFLLCGCVASERDMGALKLQLKELNETLAVMQTNQAELAGKIEELNQNLSVSGEKFSELDSQMTALSAKLDDITAVVKQNPAAAQEAAPALLPSEVFNEAKSHLNLQAYDLAADGFKLYIDQYPDGENIQQAYIYLGDSYAGLDEIKPAAIAYATVLQKFPDSKLIPTARLK